MVVAQDSSAIIEIHLVSGYLKDINAKADRLEQKLDKFTMRALRKAQKQEGELRSKLAKRDSAKAETVFGNTEEQYKQLEQRLQHPKHVKQYIPVLDTLSTSLKFLEQDPNLNSLSNGSERLKETLAKVNGLGVKLENAEEVV